MPSSTNISDLLPELSRPNTDLVAGLVLQKPELFDALFQVFLGNEEPASRRAAWVVDLVSEKNPHWLEPRIPEIIRMLPEFGHNGLKRHSMRMLARSPLPSGDLLGALMSICFDWLVSSDEAVSTKVYCMELLYRIAQIEPDLRKELADTIEWRMNEESAGFRNRGQKLLCRLNAEMYRASKT